MIRGVLTVNALTIDLEDWYHGIELPPVRWRAFEYRLVPATERLLSILAEHDVRATFFVLGDVAARHPGTIVASFPKRYDLRAPLRRLRFKLDRCPLFLYSRAAVESTLAQAGIRSFELVDLGRDYVAVAHV
jgi:peptidoglycan/xylan/chitin deacetylase (PgdA/CDA1 family)